MKRENTKNIDEEKAKTQLRPHSQLLPNTINCQIEMIDFVFQIEPSRAWH